MKVIFNNSNFKKFNYICIPLITFWSLSNIGGSFLSQQSIEGFSNNKDSFFELFRFSDKFGISKLSEKTNSMGEGKKVLTKTLIDVPHILKGTYRSNEKSFISIENGNKTDIVFLNKVYNNNLKLISIGERTATFKGFGKLFKLTIGINGSLPKEEVTTNIVYDTPKAIKETEEWRSISHDSVVEQTSDIMNINKKINFSIVRDEDSIVGFRVEDIDSNSIFSQLGIIQGDVIESVNNKKLQSYADIMQIYNKIPQMRSIRISIKRNNLQKDVVYEITR
jgi:type II secretion system protein C